MKSKFIILAGILGILIIVISVYFSQATPTPTELTEVTIGMTYIPNVQFAPWYVAQEQGYFTEAGLKVNFDYRMDVDAMKLVATEQMDFTIAGGDQVITAAAQNIPVVYLMSLYSKFPPAIIALAESGIKTPVDLKDKSIGLPLYGTNLLAVKAILNQAQIPESEVNLVDIGYTQITSLTSKKVDAVVGFVNNETIKLEAEGYEISVINAWDYFSLVGHGLITGKEQIAKNPKTVGKLVTATLKGMEYSLKHPQEALEICFKYIPEISEAQKRIEEQVFLQSLALWENKYTTDHGLGHFNPNDWDQSQALMYELKLIPKSTPVEQIINTSFLP